MIVGLDEFKEVLFLIKWNRFFIITNWLVML
ncbi:MAG: hypothetical protein JWN15_2234 [Firmicutes bacterium]|nr:hypothetical protein [Bacillota bacterium]